MGKEKYIEVVKSMCEISGEAFVLAEDNITPINIINIDKVFMCMQKLYMNDKIKSFEIDMLGCMNVDDIYSGAQWEFGQELVEQDRAVSVLHEILIK